jgi:ribosomal protein L37AE/L43A
MTRSDLMQSDLTHADIGEIPRQNPCAQCGTPIAHPDWIEPGNGRVSYLWKCRACGYRFEAIAFYDQQPAQHALAA